MASKQGGLFDEGASHNPDTYGDNQQDACHAPLGAQEVPRLRSLCRVRVIHHRNRLIDADNLNAKAAIDQLVALGILADDSPQQIAAVTHTQVKVRGETPEKTIIEIEEIEPGEPHAND